MSAPENPAPALLCEGVSKRFGSNLALDGVNLRVAPGTIHALCGENGAGKSTLMNVVSGLLQADSGKVEIHGARAKFSSPLDAVAAGIGMVHQHFLLAEGLTVIENVELGRRGSPFGWRFKRREAEQALAVLSTETGLAVDPKARVADLPVGLRQRVEILKALSRGARILLLDEPTAVLAPPEVHTLFATLERLRASGRTIILITHKLAEVFALATEVTVLRRGKQVFADTLQGLTPAELAREMVGEAADIPAPVETVLGATVLEAAGLTAPGEHGTGLREATFTLRAGEILGVAGVEGNGQDELAGVLAGTHALKSGRIRFLEKDCAEVSVAGRVEAGLALIPSDRHHEGLVLDLSLAENLFLRGAAGAKGVEGAGAWPKRFTSAKDLNVVAASRLREFGVVPPEPALPAAALSGGNQQKVVIARELARSPKLLLACNPTRGLDVAAAAAVHARIVEAARKHGAAVLLISSDLDEVLHLSDSIAVLYAGRLKVLGSRGVERERVGRAMVGADLEPAPA